MKTKQTTNQKIKQLEIKLKKTEELHWKSKQRAIKYAAEHLRLSLKLSELKLK